MGFQPDALRELQGIAPVQAATGGEVDVFDAGVDEAQLGCGQPIGQAPVGTHGGFAIEHQTEPLVAAEFGGIVLLGQLTIAGRHSGKAESLHLVEGRVCQHHDLPFIGNRCRPGCWRGRARL